MLNGRLLGGDPLTPVRHVSFDSRDIPEDTLFVPTRGARVDGHDFIEKAFAAGAAATLTEREEIPRGTHPAVLVEDTTAALQRLAAKERMNYRGRVIGITGSVGKTTTREMVKAALSAGYTVTGSEKNMNSQLGTPVVLCHMDYEAQRAVIEMGISEPGEMKKLVSMVRPHAVAVTNIGVAHIEYLGSREGICEEKMHIADTLGEDGVAVLNGEEPLLTAYRDRLPGRVLTYGLEENMDVYGTNLELGDTASFTAVFKEDGLRVPVRLSVPGRHNVMNALAALVLARAEGVDPAAAAAALEGFGGFKRRLERIRIGEQTLIDDSYNAGPPSMKAALDVLARATGRRIAVLADMLELGEDSARLHREVGEYAAALPIDLYICMGKEIRALEEALAEAGRTVFHTENLEETLELVKKVAAAGDVLLLKGSNSMRLDEIVRGLRQE